MQLESARAELRERPPYEAADLGVRLLRVLFRPALWAWLGFVLPLQLCVLAACSPFHVATSYLAIWWLKPAYDRAWGLVIGRGLFGDPPGLRALYGALWSAGRRGLLGDLLWRRLDPARSLVAPVSLLEGLTGNAAARRRRSLSEGSGQTVRPLLAACLALELATSAGLVAAGSMLLPDEAKWFAADAWSLDAGAWFGRVCLAAYVLALAIIEPLFVASGFGLYINRRTNLEGWDVELTFRRMARRLSPLAATQTPAALGAALALLLTLPCAPLCAHAEAQAEAALVESVVDDEALRMPAPALDYDAGSAAAMARVLDRPELQRTHVEEHWELRYQPSSDETPADAPLWLSVLAGFIARSFVLLLWLLGAGALVIAIYLVVRHQQRTRARADAGRPPPAPVTLRGHTDKETALPTREVVPRALALLAEGRHVAALSVLYVGTLTALVRQDRLELPRQATEGQCLAVVRGAPIAEERRALFSELTQLWQLSAYAHVAPENARLTQMCARFDACFGSAA